MNDTHKFPFYRLEGSPQKGWQKIQFDEHPEWWNRCVVQAHHYVEKHLYNAEEAWYIERGIEQWLVLIPRAMHDDLHSAMSDERFFKRWKIECRELLFNKDRWLEENA